MPHKVSIDNVEKFFDGSINDQNIRKELVAFLKEENDVILSITEKQKPKKSIFEAWEFYGPTLSRHLSKSSLEYIKAILEHPLLLKQFIEIENIINSPRTEKNENEKKIF